MIVFKRFSLFLFLTVVTMVPTVLLSGQDLPPRYPTLELFTNTPCPNCGSQNPGLFNRLQAFEGQYHLISFHPGKPYSSCIFYQANKSENTARWQFYSNLVGTPTVGINGIDFKSSNGVTNTVLNAITGLTSWLQVKVEETPGSNRTVDITLKDHVGGSLSTGRLFAVIVEKEIAYSAPNGETIHRNVFRKFLSPTGGEDVDLSGGTAVKTYSYTLDANWQADQVYVIAWLKDPVTKEIYNSGTRFDPDFTSAIGPLPSATPLLLYPNPAAIEVRLAFPSGVTSGDLRVYDQQGRLVRSITAQAGPEVRISTVDLHAGQYIVRLESDRNVYTGVFDVVR